VKRPILLLQVTRHREPFAHIFEPSCFPRDARCQPLSSQRDASIGSTNFFDAITQMASQERPPGNAIGVAHTSGNLIDALIAGLE